MATAAEIDIVLRARDQMTATLRKASSEVGGFGKAVQSITHLAAGFGLAQVALSGAAKAFELGSNAVVGFNARMEQASKAFTTMLGSGEKARAFLNDLERFAAETPFEFPELVQASQRMLAMGFSAQQVVPLLTDVGNAVAALGGGSEQVKRVTLALGQMQSATKVTAEDMNQLIDVGIPAWQLLADAIGKSVGETRKLAEEGKISSAVFIQAFQDFSKARFGDAMADQAKTWNGALSTIKDNLTSAVATGFKPFFDLLSTGAQRLAQFSKTRDFQVWAQSVALHVQFAINAVGVLAPAFQRAFENIARIVLSIGTIILNAFALLSPFTRRSPSLVDEVQRGFGVVIPQTIQDMVPRIMPALQAAGDAVSTFAGVVGGTLAAAAAQAQAALEKTVSFLGGGAVAAFRDAQAAIDELTIAQRELADALSAAERLLSEQEAALKPLQAAASAAEKKFQTLKSAISQARQALADFARVPLAGEKEARDKVFSLEQQIKQKRLELLELARKPGESAKDFEQRRLALEAEIKSLEKAAEIERLRAEINFDPQRKTLEDIANTEKEITFQDAVAGAVAMAAKLAELEAALPAMQQAAEASAALVVEQQALIEAQKAVVDELRMAHEGVSKELAIQQARLDAMVKVAHDLEAAAKAAASALKGGGAGISLPGMPGAPGEGRPDDPDLGAHEDTGLGRIAAELTKKLAELQKAADDVNSPLQTATDRLAEFAGSGKTAAEALTALQTAWETNAKPAISALVTMMDTEAKRSTLAWARVIDEDLVPALNKIKAWWDGPGGRATLGAFGSFLETDLAKVAFGQFASAYRTLFLGPLNEFVLWWKSPEGEGTLRAIDTWMRTTLPEGILAFQRAVAGVGPKIDEMNARASAFLGDQGSKLLAWATDTGWPAIQTAFQSLIDFLGGAFATAVNIAVTSGPLAELLKIIEAIRDAIEKAIKFVSDLADRIRGLPSIPSLPGGGGGGSAGASAVGAAPTSITMNIDNRGNGADPFSIGTAARDGALAALARSRLVAGVVGA